MTEELERSPGKYSSGPDGLMTFVLDPLNTGEHLASWRKLAEEALDPNPFFAPDFLVPYLDNIGRQQVKLLAIADKTTGNWLMAAPVGTRKLGFAVPAATTWVTDYGPLGSPLLAPGAPEGIASVFFSLVAKTTRTPLICLPYLPLDGETAEPILATDDWHPAKVQIAERACHSDGEGGMKQFSKAYRGKRRKELKRLVRRLSDEGEVAFVSYRGDELIHQFENFLQLEAAGWKGERGTALLSRQDTAKFARELIARHARTARLDAVTVGGRPIAMLVMLRQGKRAFSWKITYDETYARYSPGSQLALYAFEENLADPDICGADSLAIPGHSMIEPLWRGRMQYGTVLLARSAAGFVLQKSGVVDLTLRQRLKDVAKTFLRRGRP